MKTVVIAFSDCGASLAARIIGGLSERGHECQGYIAERHAAGSAFEAFASVYELAARLFDERDALVFVSASGIAVRAVAPLLKSKLSDPAVVVCDEAGRFAVSLLSGHVGGANALTEEIAAITGAVPVITTASDSHAALESADQRRDLVLGVGCRRGLSAEVIERAATILLWDHGIPFSRVSEIATIDVKKDEAGLLAFADAHTLPLRFYTAEELAAVEGEFSASEWVSRTVGVDNVCERAAVLCGGEKGSLIVKKAAYHGVTVAAFQKEQRPYE